MENENVVSACNCLVKKLYDLNAIRLTYIKLV